MDDLGTPVPDTRSHLTGAQRSRVATMIWPDFRLRGMTSRRELCDLVDAVALGEGTPALSRVTREHVAEAIREVCGGDA